MIALTGATGHLGQSLVRQLRARGDAVSAAVRASSDLERLDGFCDRIVEAPLDDVEALARCFDGCDAVIHAAALIDIRRGQVEKLTRANVRGTANVLEACRRAGVRRLAYVSSIEAFNLEPKRRPVREDFGFARGNAVMDYGESKAEASRLVTAEGLAGTMETVLVCPTGIIGPWDFHGGYMTVMIRRYLKRRLPASVGGGMDFVDVRDVAGAVLAALERGRSGEAYLAAGEYRTIPEIFRILEGISGVRPPGAVIPLPVAGMAGRFSEAWSRITGSKALFTKGSMDILGKDIRVDTAKAAEELGFRQRPMEETLRDTIAWIRGDALVNPEPNFS